MRQGKRTRFASGIAIAGLACAVYAWSVLGAFGASAHSSAFASASEYQYSAGHVSGDGTILSKSLTYSFDVKADTQGLRGPCKVTEGKANRIDCESITSLVVVGTHATFTGTADHNGVQTTFTIDVDDLGTPGKGTDRFAIKTATGFARSGLLSSGNIVVQD
jgi:hypothetical protein